MAISQDHLTALPLAGATLSKAVIRAAELLKLRQSTVADVLGVSEPTASRLFSGAYKLDAGRKREWEFAVLFVRVFRSLDAIVGHGEEARLWLHGPNQAFAGERPVELIRSAQGLIRVLNYLDAARGRI